MGREINEPFDKESLRLLCRAFASLETEQECMDFLEDRMTIREVQDISQRLYVAKLLQEGEPYAKIIARTCVSSATISRVNRCYSYGSGGYRRVLERIARQDQEEDQA